MSLHTFLNHGLTELRYTPDDGSATEHGFFTDANHLSAAITTYETKPGKLQLGLQPRPASFLERAPNVMRPLMTATEATDIKQFTAFTLVLPLTENALSRSEHLCVQTQQPTPLVVTGLNAHLLVWRCTPLLVADDNRVDLLNALANISSRYSSVYPGAVSTMDLLQWVDLPVSTQNDDAVYSPNPLIDHRLPKSIDVEIHAELLAQLNTSPNCRTSKLFESKGKVGRGAKGAQIPPTPENYDKAFVNQVAADYRHFSILDLATAVWSRVDGHAKRKGRAYCIALAEAARRAAPPPSTYDEDDAAEEGASLRDVLHEMYYDTTAAGRLSPRHGIPVTKKAKTVLNHLLAQGTRFQRLAGGRVQFTVKGKQVEISNNDVNFTTWFETEIGLFGAATNNGRELIAALKSHVLSQPADDRFLNAETATWGFFDRKNSELYFCLDPDSAEIVRIGPAHEDGTPDVTIVPNGFNRVVLTRMTGRVKRFNYVADNAEAWAFFQNEVHGAQSLNPIARLVSTAYNLAAMIPGHQARPIKFHKGGNNSGKTYSMYDFETLLYGKRVAVTYQKEQKEAFYSALTEQGPIITFDNCETKERNAFKEILKPLATGAGAVYRQLYSNAGRVEYKPNGTLVLTAIEGMTEPETLQRVFEFEFIAARKDMTTRLSEADRQERIAEHADAMLSAVFDIFSTKILPNWRDQTEDALAYIREHHGTHPKARNNDFLLWVLMLVEATSGSLYAEPSVQDARYGEVSAAAPRTLFRVWLDKQSHDHEQADLESNVVLEAIEALRDAGVIKLSTMTAEHVHKPNYISGVKVTWRIPTPDDATTWVIGPFSYRQLNRAFTGQAAKDLNLSGLLRPFENPRQLLERMTASKDTLARAGWTWTKEGKVHDNYDGFILRYAPVAKVLRLPVVAPATPAAAPEDDEADYELDA